MDLLRGVSIILVIFNHAVLFSTWEEAGAPAIAVTLNSILAPVRMPLMVFLSGLLLAKALRKPVREYVGGKARRILYPFAVWTLIVIACEGAFNILNGDDFPYSHLAKAFYAPAAHTWFLYYLFWYYIVALVTRKVSPAIVAAATLVLCAIAPDNAQRMLLLLTFFMLGKWVSDNVDKFERFLASRGILAAAAAFSISLVALAFLGVNIRYEAVSAPVVAAGIIVMIHLGRKVQHVRWLGPVRNIGRDSLVYYLGHWYGVAAGVWGAGILAGGSPWAMVTLGTLSGLTAGWLIQWAYRHVPGVRALFEWPAKPRLRTAAGVVI